uniref:Uncharacterized protein n=1 Tax=Arundo donax TaxID=35708 RepID=A0A0A9E2B7_ARUDO
MIRSLQYLLGIPEVQSQSSQFSLDSNHLAPQKQVQCVYY